MVSQIDAGYAGVSECPSGQLNAGYTPDLAQCTSSTLNVLTLVVAEQGLALVPEPLQDISIQFMANWRNV